MWLIKSYSKNTTMEIIYRKGSSADLDQLQKLGSASYGPFESILTQENWEKLAGFFKSARHLHRVVEPLHLFCSREGLKDRRHGLFDTQRKSHRNFRSKLELRPDGWRRSRLQWTRHRQATHGTLHPTGKGYP